jgi:hypothetical protein
MRFKVFLLLATAFCPSAWCGAGSGTSLRWGFDDIGVQGRDCRNEGCLLMHPKATELLEELRFNLWVTWYPDKACSWSYERNREYVRRIDAFCEKHHMDWVANQLAPLWNTAPERCIDPEGHDWFNRSDGRHCFQFPEPLLSELGRCSRLLGLLYDEAEHHQNNANAVPGLDLPSIYDPNGDELVDAADGHTAAAAATASHHLRYGLRLYTEQVFPVMFHDFARAGFTAGTKVLKEGWAPVQIACAMGAAIQYNTELWVSPDLWGIQGYPGHSPAEYFSALVLAYHMGADCIYTESLALDHGNNDTGSLILMTPEDYRLTPYGEAAKQFIREYVPAHPRHYSFRGLRPRVVVIRQEDGDWGQANAPYPWTPNRLFGSKTWKSTEITRAWFKIWHLLTRGAVPETGLTWWCDGYRGRPYEVLCPLDGVVVYDHLVRYEHLEGAEVLFLTGISISRETLDAVSRCVREGATCISLPHLAPEHVRDALDDHGVLTEGQGRWVVDADFLSETVRDSVASLVPQDDCIRYRFGDAEVVFSPVDGDMNRVAARVHQIGVSEDGKLPLAP